MSTSTYNTISESLGIEHIEIDDPIEGVDYVPMLSPTGELNPFYGKSHSQEWKKEASKRSSGKNNPMYGVSRKGEFLGGAVTPLFGEANGMYGVSRKGERVGGAVTPLFGEANGMYGKTHSEEAKEKQREAALRRPPDTEETRRKKSLKGKSNGMYGRSITKEKNLRWYNDGEKAIYVPEGTQPKNFKKGRKLCRC